MSSPRDVGIVSGTLSTGVHFTLAKRIECDRVCMVVWVILTAVFSGTGHGTAGRFQHGTVRSMTWDANEATEFKKKKLGSCGQLPLAASVQLNVVLRSRKQTHHVSGSGYYQTCFAKTLSVRAYSMYKTSMCAF